MSLFDKLSNSVPFLSKKEITEYFFALNIGNDKLVAAVWGVEGKKLRIVNTAQTAFQSEEQINFDNFLEAATRSLDEALADFEFDPVKILFGVPESWLQDDNLKEDYIKILRRLVKELDLAPMAYVSSVHAVSHLLQKEQGVPPTTVLANLSNPMVVSVIKAGKLEGTREVKRTHTLAEDIQKALLGLTNIEVLPAKIMLIGSTKGKEDYTALKDELMSFPWMQKLPFLHLPKVEILDEGAEIQAISLAGAVEIVPEVIFHRQKIAHHSLDMADPGFVKGDIESTKEERVAHETKGYEEEDILAEEEPTRRFGRLDEMEHHPMVISGHEKRLSGDYGGEKGRLPGLALISLAESALSPITRIFGRRFGSFVPLLVVGFLLLGVILGYLFLPKAKVIVYVDQRNLEKEAQVTADPALTSVDEAGKKIPGKIAETDVIGTGKGVASGKKQIGDPAKGKVIIYNATGQPLTLAQGAILTTDSGLKFKLDSSIQVASKSASAADPPTKSQPVNVTAVEIGADGNIPALTDLKVGNNAKSDVVAKSDEAFSGGASKDVTVISEDDRKKLLAQLSSDLRKRARDELQGKLEGDFKVLEESLSEQILKATYSKAVGDQASEFSLNLSVRYKGTAYSDNDLKSIVSKLIEVGVPEGYELRLAESETQAAVSKVEKDGKLVFTAKFKAKLMPKFDIEKLKKEIAFKAPAQAGEALKGTENVVASDIQLIPSLPGPLQRLPFNTKNIEIEVKTR